MRARRTDATHRATLTEKVVQQQIVNLLRSIGASVYVLGHPSPNDGRAHRGTGQTPGIPDLFVFMPIRNDVGAYAPAAIWIEVKRRGGKASPAQIEFECDCYRAAMPYLRGGLDDVIAWLVQRGYVKAKSLPHYRQPAV